jgi:crotonobetainyl-CoA:carnitine CoA-transferase CaiB-like acyl-CoA transferase
MQNGTLDGVRVVDLSSVVVGPVATQTLADYGADVIKVESLAGDLLRTLGGNSRSGQLAPKFMHFNRNKRSIAIDLKSEAGMCALRKLIESADVVVANMRPAALKRLGLDGESLLASHANLIVCRLIGFGQGGRYRDRPAYDSIIQSVSGIAATFAQGDNRPRYVPMTIADHIVGIIATQMMLMALYHRERTGEGQVIDVPMFENMAAFVMSEHLGQQTYVPARGPFGDARVLDPRAQPIATRDGFISISANTDAQAFALFDAIGMPELKYDPRFNSVGARYRNVSEYFEVRERGLKQKSSAEWMDILIARDIPAAPCHTFETLLEDEHLADVGLFRSVESPEEGPIIDIGLPNQSSVGPRNNWNSAPLKGEHSSAILREIGYSEKEIDCLIRTQAVYDGAREGMRDIPTVVSSL